MVEVVKYCFILFFQTLMSALLTLESVDRVLVITHLGTIPVFALQSICKSTEETIAWVCVINDI